MAELWMDNFEVAESVLSALAKDGGDHADEAAGVLGRYYFEELGRWDDDVKALLSQAQHVDDHLVVSFAALLAEREETADAEAILRAQAESGNADARSCWAISILFSIDMTMRNGPTFAAWNSVTPILRSTWRPSCGMTVTLPPRSGG
jgi:hypothetical protein